MPIKVDVMLVLGRKVGERVMIGHDVIVTILGLDRGVVRVGIEAPKDIGVHRETVYNLIEKERNERISN